jgi:hypothetical protein
LPYKKNVDEFNKGLSSWFFKNVLNKRCYLFVIKAAHPRQPFIKQQDPAKALPVGKGT